jgi:SAM-dependent methyltransferase
MVARRAAVLAALDAGVGDRVLEVGCGAGSYLREIALAVGPSGSAIGVDRSQDQVDVARERCHDLGQVRVMAEDLSATTLADDEADAVVAVQVLEYVADVDGALAEIARVTRPGGRLVNVATNWHALFWSGGEPDLTGRVLAAWEGHAPHPNLPVQLPVLLRSHGFAGIAQRPVTIVNRQFHPNSFSWGAARLMAAFAITTGAIQQGEAEAWFEGLDAASNRGEHFLSSVPILTTATAIGQNP